MGDRFAAIAPTVGAPLVGFDLPTQDSSAQISFMTLWGRNDRTVPPDGGCSSDGGFYSPVVDYTATWADFNGCSGQSAPWEGNPVGSGPGGTNLQCTTPFGNSCETAGTAVVSCSFNGNHFTSISA